MQSLVVECVRECEPQINSLCVCQPKAPEHPVRALGQSRSKTEGSRARLRGLWDPHRSPEAAACRSNRRTLRGGSSKAREGRGTLPGRLWIQFAMQYNAGVLVLVGENQNWGG